MTETSEFTPPNLLRTAVLFLVFNRLDTTKQVFEAIRQAKPPRLYIAADGPRADRPGEGEKVQAVRDYVMDSIDWECEVKTLFWDENLGCKYAISGAINWFFENEEMGIILEDDCVPDNSFFPFCQELLELYRDDKRMAMISGNNFQFDNNKTGESYYFSRYTHIWGWASWRRAWKNYDINMSVWPDIRDSDWLKYFLKNKKCSVYWTKIFEKTYSGQIDTWDYQWLFSCWAQNQLCIIPNVNLVSNIGFGSEAVHTFKKNDLSDMQTEIMKFPLKNPEYMVCNIKADEYTEKTYYTRKGFLRRLSEFLLNF